MSVESTPVTAKHFKYLANRTAGDDGFLKALQKKALAAGIPPIWIAPEQAAFLEIQLRLIGARRVLEVGTLAGYAAIRMARALPPNGRLETVEISPACADFAEEWIAKSDVAGKVRVIRGDARRVLPTLTAGAYDAVFLDADKEGYPVYLSEAMRLLRPGGLFLADNAFAFGQLFEKSPTDKEVEAVRRFNDLVPKTGGLKAVIVPIGDGCWVGVKE